MANKASLDRGDLHSASRKYWTKTELAKISKVNTYQIDDFLIERGLRPAVSRRLRSGGIRTLYGRNAYNIVMEERKRKDALREVAPTPVVVAPAVEAPPIHETKAPPQLPSVAAILARQFNLIQEKLDMVVAKVTAIERTLADMAAHPRDEFSLDLGLDFEPETRQTNGQ
jgi:hypothetical protein